MRIERGTRVEHVRAGGRTRGTVLRVLAEVRVDGVNVDHHTYDVANLLPITDAGRAALREHEQGATRGT